MSVDVINCEKRTNLEGEDFFVLIVQGGVEAVKSSITDQFYLTARKSSVSTTFTEEICKSLIGTKLPGSVKRIACEPYSFTIPDTGEVVTRDHRWRYLPDVPSMEEVVFEEEKQEA